MTVLTHTPRFSAFGVRGTVASIASDCQRIPSPAMTRHEFAWLRR